VQGLLAAAAQVADVATAVVVRAARVGVAVAGGLALALGAGGIRFGLFSEGYQDVAGIADEAIGIEVVAVDEDVDQDAVLQRQTCRRGRDVEPLGDDVPGPDPLIVRQRSPLASSLPSRGCRMPVS